MNDRTCLWKGAALGLSTAFLQKQREKGYQPDNQTAEQSDGTHSDGGGGETLAFGGGLAGSKPQMEYA